MWINYLKMRQGILEKTKQREFIRCNNSKKFKFWCKSYKLENRHEEDSEPICKTSIIGKEKEKLGSFFFNQKLGTYPDCLWLQLPIHLNLCSKLQFIRRQSPNEGNYRRDDQAQSTKFSNFLENKKF